MAFEGFLKGKREKKETTESPKVFNGVEFEAVYDSSGRVVRYKSSSFGRKEIRLEDRDFSPRGRRYEVKIVKDSDPGNPDSGYYEAEIVGINYDPLVFDESEGYKQVTREAKYLEREKKALEEQIRENRFVSEATGTVLARSLIGLEDRYQEFLSTVPLVKEQSDVQALVKSTIGDFNSYGAFLNASRRKLYDAGYRNVYEDIKYSIQIDEGTNADERQALVLQERFQNIRANITGPRVLNPDTGRGLASSLATWRNDFQKFKVDTAEGEPKANKKELLARFSSLDEFGTLESEIREKVGKYYIEDFNRNAGRLTGMLLSIKDKARGLDNFSVLVAIQGELLDLIDQSDTLYSDFVEIRGSVPMLQQQEILERLNTLRSDSRAYASTVEDARRPLLEERQNRALEERIRSEERNRPRPVAVESLVERAVGDKGEFMESRHKEVLRSKASRLKKSPAFQALTSILHDEEIARPYHLMLTRKEEMLDDQEEDERHRSLAPMFSALMMHRRTKELTELALHESVRERSARIKEVVSRVRNEGPVPFVKEVVIGSGPHSAIYAINRQMVLPDDPSLTLERANVIGGQFAQMGGELFALNSRTRPERRGENYLPGTGNSLNTFTAFATTQPGDTGGEAYQKQSVLGDHARLNLFLSGEPVVGAEVRRVRQLPYSDRYVVEFVDTSTSKILEVETDRIIFTTGVGEEQTRLNENDRTTKEILDAERTKFEEGKDALVLSFSQAASRLADPENPFPLKDFRRIILSGEGDGGKVLAGVLLGYEGQLAMTATQLDSVEEIIWLGQSYPTKEAFIENCRARYHQIGLEFPRERFDQYYARIRPKADARAERLVRVGSEIRVITNTGEKYDGDHFIYAHGFEDRTNEIIAPVFTADSYEDNPPYSKEALNDDVSTYPYLFFFEPALKAERNGEKYKSTDLVRIETKPVSTGVEITRVLRDGTYTVSNPAEFSAEAFFKEFQSREEEFVNALPIYNFRISNASTYTARGDTSPSARKYGTQNIYRIGPSANLPLTEEERRESQALANISENTAAIFRYADKTARLAIELARLDADESARTRDNDLYTKLRAAENSEVKAALPPVPKRARKPEMLSPRTITLEGKERLQRIPFAMPSGDILRLGLGSVLERYTAPESLSHLEVSLRRTGDDSTSSHELLLDPKLPDEYREALRRAFDSELSQAALERFFERKQHQNSEMHISIPFVRGKVDAARIGFARSKT
jgi:hypothetical protein